jgi:DNA-binding transcriptional ArsR family regulator
MRDSEQITDPQTMRALAHPVRLALLEAIRRDGELTATRAAELLDESPGNMSWHLQTLAKYGFIEEAGGGKGRSRPWKLVSQTHRFVSDPNDPQSDAAGGALINQVLERGFEQSRQWLTDRHEYSSEWQNASFLAESLAYLTSEELSTIAEEVRAIYERYAARTQKQSRPAGALPIRLIAQGHPLPQTAAGN